MIAKFAFKSGVTVRVLRVKTSIYIRISRNIDKIWDFYVNYQERKFQTVSGGKRVSGSSKPRGVLTRLPPNLSLRFVLAYLNSSKPLTGKRGKRLTSKLGPISRLTAYSFEKTQKIPKISKNLNFHYK